VQLAALLGAGILGSACSSDGGPSEIQDLVNSIQVALGLNQLTVGQTVQAGAIARDASGGALSGIAIAWSTSNTSVVTVSSSGMVTAVAPGQATITGTVGTKSASANVTVVQVSVASVSVALTAASVQIGQPVSATATTRDASNAVITGRPVSWSSSNLSVATISGTGAITAVGAGVTTITATSENVTGTATLTVASVPVASVTVTLGSSLLNPGSTTQASAVIRDAANNTLAGRGITWSSSNISVATVTSEGLVSAVGAGSTTITAASENVTGSAGVTVQQSVTSVTVTIADNPISVTKTTQATATLRDINNTVLTNRAVTWTSSNTAVATVSTSGVVTGVAIGNAAITATSETISGSAAITVQLTVGSVTVSLGTNNLRSGVTTLATASVRDANGLVLLGRTIGWSSSNSAVASVSADGTVLGGVAGTANITASVEGVLGSAGVTVTAGSGGPTVTPTQLVITQQPSGASSGVGFSAPPVVEIRDANNLLVQGTNNVVTATIASGPGTIGGSAQVVAVNGVANFASLKINGLGTHSLTFTSPTLTSVTSASFNVTQAPAALQILTQPSGAVTGSNLTSQPVVRIVDGGGVVVAGSTLAVTATITNGNGTLLGTAQVTAVNGVATFTNLRVDGIGSHVLTFSTTTPALSIASAAFSVQGGPATQLVLVTAPAGAVSGVNLATQPVVHVRDVSNGTVAGATQAVTASIATGSGTLSGTTTVQAVNGVVNFGDLRINGSGAHTLTFTSAPLTSVTSGAITVTQNLASLSIQTQPAGATTGVPFTTQPVVRILDNAGLPVAGATNQVTATVSSGGGTIGGTTQVAAVNGVATFTNLQVTGAGNHVLTFSIASPALAVATPAFNVSGAGAASLLGIATQPSGAVSGVNLTAQPVVQIRDANGVLVNSATNQVTATITTGSGTLVGTATVTAVAGVATFTNLRVNGAGSHVITFSAGGLTSIASTAFTVTQNVGSLSIQTAPAGAVTGSVLATQPVIRILDNAGLVIASGPNASLSVNVVPTSNTATLTGTTLVNSVNGVATYTNLRLDRNPANGAASTVLTFNIASPAINVASGAVAVAVGPATQLIITQQPASGSSGFILPTQPIMRVADVAGNTVTSYTGAVTASVASGVAVLAGTTSVNAVAGIATFSNLMLTGATGAYTLGFQSASPTLNATSATFNLVSPGTLNGTIIGGPGTGQVEVLSGSTRVAIGPVAGGTYSIGGLAPGSYTARYHPPMSAAVVGADPTVTVTSGNTTTQGFTATTANNVVLYNDNFQSYTSSAQLTSGSAAAAGNFWNQANLGCTAGPGGPCRDIGTVSNPGNSISLDPTGGFNGDKAMRYDWPARLGHACSGDEITIAVQPRLYPPPTGMQDLWVRFTSKENTAFEHGINGCGGNSYKFFLVQFETIGKQGRFGTYLYDAIGVLPRHQSSDFYMDQTDNQGTAATFGGIQIGAKGPTGWGGAYHTWVIELHGLGTANATFSTWKDGVKLATINAPFLAGQTLGPGWAVTFEMGANMNNGPETAQSRWFREFGVYTQRPSLVP
jgi:uncharacterized protein YjdB